ncbi:hypothetical protein [Paraglaciecola chathamensis]|uniref:Lipoprotein n=1 Tax=Paraglaciecola chathamensis TaxID=368405 RepID=A0A8H9LXX7_9ALTE|nr:hypothetical protein [Paraglaciecola oceanifecundans]GGZ75669.1 hypothetical protein GCM10011274_37490 [Paraglaciecola oceanifecundans]
MKYAKNLFSFFLFSTFLLSNAVNAKGLFDDLDYCIEAKNEFNHYRQSMINTIQWQIRNPNLADLPPPFRTAWWEEKKAIMFNEFRSKYENIIAGSGGNTYVAFTNWLQQEGIPSNGGTPALEQAMRAEYERLYLVEKNRLLGATRVQLERQKDELYGQCRPDVASQLVRASTKILNDSINIAKRSPVLRTIHNNLRGSERESGLGAKVIRGTSGISVRDIKEHGPGGGPNSEVNKAGRAIADVFGW